MLEKTFYFVVFLALGGCGAVGPIQKIAPFSDRLNETYAFQYAPVNVTGAVWSFERDGTYLSFGGPLGFPYQNRPVNAVSISGTKIQLLTVSDVVGSSSEELKDLMDAAETYCIAAGYIPQGNVANLHTKNGKLYLIGFCLPENAATLRR